MSFYTLMKKKKNGNIKHAKTEQNINYDLATI